MSFSICRDQRRRMRRSQRFVSNCEVNVARAKDASMRKDTGMLQRAAACDVGAQFQHAHARGRLRADLAL
jgi:hypothetical protein